MYLWIKAFHIIAVITWFAGIFYLPRLFVYHAMAEDQPSRERFKVMERKLYRGIMTPSAVIAVALGFWMLWLMPAWAQQGWFHVKMLAVVALLAYHGYCWKLLADFREDRNTKSHVWFRWFNEIPVAILLLAVIMVVVKPF